MRIITILLLIGVCPDYAAAVAKAWLIGSNKAIKIDIATNKIEKEAEVDIEQGVFFFDQRKGNLFILQRSGRFESAINMYDVKTLQKKGDLGIVINTNIMDEVNLLFPKTGNLFYLRWTKEEDGPPEIVAYDATSLKPANRYTTTPPTTNKLMLSAGGDLLYSIVQDETTEKINIFQTSDFTYKSAVDIKKLFTLGTEGGIGGYEKEKILISEVITRTPQLEYFEFIYDIAANKITPKIRMAIKGDDFLLPLTKKFAISENQYVGTRQLMRLSTDYLFTGKIYIFDAVGGQRIGTALIPVDSNTVGDIIGLSPMEDKLYIRTYATSGDKNPKLHIIDLKTYDVIKELFLPEVSVDMIFFEE